MVDLEEADGLVRLDTDDDTAAARTMLFYGGHVTRFDDATTPHARRYTDFATGVVIDGAGNAEPSGISFAYSAPNPAGFPADDCLDAFDVALAPGQERAFTESLVQASGGDTPALCAPLTKTGWYRVTPQRTGRLTVEASGFDTVAAVLAGSCGAFTVLSCNDDIDSTGASYVGNVAVRRDERVWVVLGHIEYQVVSFQDYKGWRSRYIDGKEIPDWMSAPLLHEYIRLKADEGWELVSATSGEQLYGTSDKRQLFFKRQVEG